MDKRIELLALLVRDKAEPLTPETSLYSPCAYSYPRAESLFESAPGQETEILEELADLGYLQREFFDKVHICPSCSHWALNFRELCPQCGSGEVSVVQMMHHLRCGYVGPEREYQDGVQLRCPKCNVILRHIGIDYERPASSYMCAACRHIFVDSRVMVQSLNCGQVFSIERIPTRTIYRYAPTAKAKLAVSNGVIEEAATIGLVDEDLALYTRQFFLERLEQEVRTSLRYRRDLSVLLIAPDHLEEYAARHGAQARAEAIHQIARSLKDALRETDVPAVFAEDVLVLLQVDTPESGARISADRHCARLSAVVPEEGQGQKRVTVSIGIGTLAPPEVATARAVLEQASENLKQAKAAGGGCVRPLRAAHATAG